MDLNRRNLRKLSMVGMRGACAQALEELMEHDTGSLILTADVQDFSGLDSLQKRYPDRIINTGIAEQNMIGIAAGLAKDGWKVFATTYANFITMRCYEQVRLNLGYMKFPVCLIGNAAGVSMGYLGNTHYAIEDMALMRAIPNMTILSPADSLETFKMIEQLAGYEHPVYLRLTGTINQAMIYKEDYVLELGTPVLIREGNDITLFATGTMVSQAVRAAETLEEAGISACVVNIHTIKPLTFEKIKPYLENKKMYITIEEHSIIGGLGSALAQATEGDPICPGLRIGLPDRFPTVGDYKFLLEKSGLTAEQIAETIKEQLER